MFGKISYSIHKLKYYEPWHVFLILIHTGQQIKLNICFDTCRNLFKKYFFIAMLQIHVRVKPSLYFGRQQIRTPFPVSKWRKMHTACASKVVARREKYKYAAAKTCCWQQMGSCRKPFCCRSWNERILLEIEKNYHLSIKLYWKSSKSYRWFAEYSMYMGSWTENGKFCKFRI